MCHFRHAIFLVKITGNSPEILSFLSLPPRAKKFKSQSSTRQNRANTGWLRNSPLLHEACEILELFLTTIWPVYPDWLKIEEPVSNLLSFPPSLGHFKKWKHRSISSALSLQWSLPEPAPPPLHSPAYSPPPGLTDQSQNVWAQPVRFSTAQDCPVS